MPIIISKKGKNAIKIDKSGFSQETDLQKYIFENPESIPWDEIQEDLEFFVLGREFSINAGSIDILGVDREGNIYIIETKLYKNTDKRRVIAQVLDYGASLWAFYDNPEDWIQRINQRLIKDTGDGFLESLADKFGTSEEASDEIIQAVKQNLVNGSFRFLVLMDTVPSSLKDLILFINQNSQFTIYAVELEYYQHDDFEILIPHLFGTESKKKVVSVSPPRARWDEDSFFIKVKAQISDADAVNAIHSLYNFSREKADDINWGTGKHLGAFNPKFHSLSIRSVYSVWTNGDLTINYVWLDDNEKVLQWREKYLDALRQIKPIGDKIPKTNVKSPVIPHEAWTPVVDQLIDALEHLLAIDNT